MAPEKPARRIPDFEISHSPNREEPESDLAKVTVQAIRVMSGEQIVEVANTLINAFSQAYSIKKQFEAYIALVNSETKLRLSEIRLQREELVNRRLSIIATKEIELEKIKNARIIFDRAIQNYRKVRILENASINRLIELMNEEAQRMSKQPNQDRGASMFTINTYAGIIKTMKEQQTKEFEVLLNL